MVSVGEIWDIIALFDRLKVYVIYLDLQASNVSRSLVYGYSIPQVKLIRDIHNHLCFIMAFLKFCQFLLFFLLCSLISRLGGDSTSVGDSHIYHLILNIHKITLKHLTPKQSTCAIYIYNLTTAMKPASSSYTYLLLLPSLTCAPVDTNRKRLVNYTRVCLSRFDPNICLIQLQVYYQYYGKVHSMDNRNLTLQCHVYQVNICICLV